MRDSPRSNCLLPSSFGEEEPDRYSQREGNRLNPNALVSDFDGTITDNDFYALIADRYMPEGAPDYFAAYRAGRLTHFEAMQAFFHHAPCDNASLGELLGQTRPDPALGDSVQKLDSRGWDLIVVSAGSSWYIERIFNASGVRATIHSNPGTIEDGRGLVLRLPKESPFFSPHVGIDKGAVVRDAIGRYRKVAFAGDGLPDVEPALLVPPQLRFARRLLAEVLESRGERYRGFERWQDVVDGIV
jgi:2,3-diketo-5-methylthio-1-phosphopentane phosphatase